MREIGTYSFSYHSPYAPSNRGSPAYPQDSQVSEESGPNQESDGGSTPLAQNEIFQPPSTSPGHELEGVPPASTKDSTYVNVIDAGTTESSCHATTSGRSHREGASPTSPVEKSGRALFQCILCPEREPYAQKQGLMRHYREKHQPGLDCLHPDCNYKWTRSRSYEYRKHLQKRHRLEDDKIDEILGLPPRRRRRRGNAIESDLPPHLSPPPIEHDRQSLAEPQQHPLMLPPLAVRKDAHHTSQSLVPSMEIKTTEHEYSSGLEYLAATHAPSGLLSGEEFSQLKGHLKVHGQIQFPSVHPGHYCRQPAQTRNATYSRTPVYGWWVSYQPGFVETSKGAAVARVLRAERKRGSVQRSGVRLPNASLPNHAKSRPDHF